MNSWPQIYWVALALIAIASGSQFCFITEEPETTPSPLCCRRSPEEFRPTSLHINGVKLGATLNEIASQYEFLGREDGWALFGAYEVDHQTSFLRPFLGAHFDQNGKAIVLRGQNIGYEELMGWKEVTGSGLIPVPEYQSIGSSCPPEFATHRVPGIRLVHGNGSPREYFIGNPETLARLRVRSKDGTFRFFIDD